MPLNAFCRRSAVVLSVCAGVLSVFGAEPVRAQTPAPPAEGPVLRLSMQEAVDLALDQNVDLRVQRLGPQIEDYAVSVARSGWTPNFQSSVTSRNQDNPPDSFLAGAAESIVQEQLTSAVGVGQLLPWGGNYSLSLNSGRFESNNAFLNFNPQLTSTLAFNYTQPLLRNFRMDATRQQLYSSLVVRQIADVELQQTGVVIIRNVRNAYYDLMYTIGNLRVQQQSLELAQRSLRENRSRVEIGTMAPIDIVEAEAEVAQREENVILAEAAIARAEDRVRALVLDPAAPQFWTTRIEPSDTVEFQPILIDTDAAVRTALDRRTDLATTRKRIERNDVDIRFFRNQTLPDVNALVNYSAYGLGGTQFQREPGFPPGNIIPNSQFQRSFGSVLGDAFASDFPTWSVALQVNYPIGVSTAEASLARARLQNTQAQRQLESQQLQVATQVRDLARSAQTNGKRVEATRASRALSEKRLEAEEKKFQAGMTTSFLVFQAQRDLNQARNNELQALLDYARSVVDFEAGQQAPLSAIGAGNSNITGSGTSGTTGANGTTAGTNVQRPQPQ